MGWGDRIAQAIRRWLKLQPPWSQSTITIREPYSYETDVIRNRIWYRGDADELHQLYGQLRDAGAGGSRFWAAVPSGRTIRKMHTGLPGVMVDTLVSIVMSDYDGMDFGVGNEIQAAAWEELDGATEFLTSAELGLAETLVTGGGAWRVCWDTGVTPYPWLEFYGEDRIQRHRTGGISFYTDYEVSNQVYQLEELREMGNIRYILRDSQGEPVPLDTVPTLSGLEDIALGVDMPMAVPLQIWPSTRWRGRGRSIFSGKTDDFDALDEVASQWMDAIRCGRVQRYIPEDLMPRNRETGEPMPIDDFGANYIKLRQSLRGEDGDDGKIETAQAKIDYSAFSSSYSSVLDMCLHGILSPASLGINIAADASGAAKREGKDITGFTRNKITAALETALPRAAVMLLQMYDWLCDRPMQRYAPTLSFGEYAAPDFNARVEAVRNAAACGAMSIEAQVTELWGGSKGDAWISEEIRRIKRDKGITEEEEDGAGDELP